MNTILLDGSFLDMACLLPVLLGLGLAGLLGWLLKSFLGGGNNSGTSVDLQGKYTKLEAELNAEREKNIKLVADNKKKKSNTENIAMGVAATAAVAGTAEIASLNGKLKNAKDELKKAQDATLEMQTKVNEANSKAKEAVTLNSEVETLKTRIEGLNRALETSKEDTNKYKDEFEAANSERAKLNTQLATSNVGDMQKRIEKLESDLDSSRLTNSNLTADLERLKNGPRTLAANIPAKKSDETNAEDLKAKLQSIEAELAKTKESNARFAKEIENSRLSTNVAVNEVASKNNKEIADLKNKLKVAEAELTVYAQDKLRNAQQSAKVVETTTSAPLAAAIVPVEVSEAKATEEPAVVNEPKVEAEVVAEPEVIAEPEVVAVAEVVAEPEVVAVAETPVEVKEEIKEEVKEEVKEAIAVEPQAPVVAESAAPAKADDLTVVEGIGPKIAEHLTNAGITNYVQLADAKPDAIKEILLAQGERFRMHNPGTWPEQAALLRDGKMDEFKALTDELDGGVRVSAEEKAAKLAAASQNESKANEAAEALAAAKANPDDLKVMEGIGPVLERILNEGGLYTYAQVAATDATDIKEILENAGDKMHDPTSWPQQATLLRDGKMDEFKALCDSLNGGRA